MFVYKLTSPSGKSYIGKSKDYSKRFDQHITEALNNSDRKICKAIRKYGKENISLEILEENISEDEACKLEIMYIEKFDTYKNGYNMTKGGDGIDSETQSKLKTNFYQTDKGIEERKRRSKVLKENNPSKKGRTAWNKGLLQSEETKQKIKSSLRNLYDSNPELSIEASKRTKKMWQEGIFDNRPLLSAESIQKGIESRKGFKQSERQKESVRKAKSKAFLITYADDTSEEIFGLSKFSRDRRIPLATLNHVLAGNPSKKWKIKSIINKE